MFQKLVYNRNGLIIYLYINKNMNTRYVIVNYLFSKVIFLSSLGLSNSTISSYNDITKSKKHLFKTNYFIIGKKIKQ